MAAERRRGRQGSVMDLPPEERPNQGDYKAPQLVPIDEILNKDKDDESLQRYKAQLLGNAAAVDAAEAQVAVERFTVLPNDREPIVLNINDPDLSSKPYIVKEGTTFKIQFSFAVKGQPILGLKFHNVVYRLKIKVDSDTYMVGSYAPRAEPYTYTTPEQEAPSGMLSRGHYEAVGRFVDDDQNIHAEFRYSFDIKSDW